MESTEIYSCDGSKIRAVIDIPNRPDDTDGQKLARAVQIAHRQNISLTSTDLWGGDFSDLDLSGIDLTGANLENAKFVGTNLDGAILEYTDLLFAKFF